MYFFLNTLDLSAKHPRVSLAGSFKPGLAWSRVLPGDQTTMLIQVDERSCDHGKGVFSAVKNRVRDLDV